MGRYLERAKKVIFIPEKDRGAGAAAGSEKKTGAKTTGDSSIHGASETASGRVPVGMSESAGCIRDPGGDEAKTASCQATCLSQEWPPECIESQKRFGQRHARLFPLLEQVVSTPLGRGVLVQVFANRAAVNVRESIIFVHPDEVLPINAAVHEELAPSVAGSTGRIPHSSENPSKLGAAKTELRPDVRKETTSEDGEPQHQVGNDLLALASAERNSAVTTGRSGGVALAPTANDEIPEWLRKLSRRLKEIKQRQEATCPSN